MGRAARCVELALAALLVGGCGVTTAGGGQAAGDGPAAPGTAPVPSAWSASSGSPQFPLTVRRVGGIAGFDDRIVLDATGRLYVETASVHGRVCTLAAAQQRLVVALLATLPIDARTVAAPTGEVTAVDPEAVSESDPITISVTDHLARPVDLTDPSLGEISGLIGTLVGDVTLSVPAVTRCTTKVGMPSR